MKKRNVIFTILFLLITIFIFTNSAKTADSSSEQSSSLVDWAINNLSFFFKDRSTATYYVRKFAHFSEFFVQGAFLSGALFSVKYHKHFIYVLFAGLLTACIDEYIQLFFPGRSGEVGDIFIDFGGTCLAVAVFMISWYLIKKAGKK